MKNRATVLTTIGFATVVVALAGCGQTASTVNAPGDTATSKSSADDDYLKYAIPDDAVMREYPYKSPYILIREYRDKATNDIVAIERRDHGRLVNVDLYKNKERHGIQKKWYPNGQLKSAEPYKDGNMHGIFRYWSKNGKLVGRCVFKDGNGTKIIYHENGRLGDEVEYKNNEMDGKVFGLSYDNGQITSLSYRSNGKSILGVGGLSFGRDGTLLFVAVDSGESSYSGPSWRWDESKKISLPLAYKINGQPVSAAEYAKAASTDPTLPKYESDPQKFINTYYTDAVKKIVKEYKERPPVKIPLVDADVPPTTSAPTGDAKSQPSTPPVSTQPAKTLSKGYIFIMPGNHQMDNDLATILLYGSTDGKDIRQLKAFKCRGDNEACWSWFCCDPKRGRIAYSYISPEAEYIIVIGLKNKLDIYKIAIKDSKCLNAWFANEDSPSLVMQCYGTKEDSRARHFGKLSISGRFEELNVSLKELDVDKELSLTTGRFPLCNDGHNGPALCWYPKFPDKLYVGNERAFYRIMDFTPPPTAEFKGRSSEWLALGDLNNDFALKELRRSRTQTSIRLLCYFSQTKSWKHYDFDGTASSAYIAGPYYVFQEAIPDPRNEPEKHLSYGSKFTGKIRVIHRSSGQVTELNQHYYVLDAVDGQLLAKNKNQVLKIDFANDVPSITTIFEGPSVEYIGYAVPVDQCPVVDESADQTIAVDWSNFVRAESQPTSMAVCKNEERLLAEFQAGLKQAKDPVEFAVAHLTEAIKQGPGTMPIKPDIAALDILVANATDKRAIDAIKTVSETGVHMRREFLTLAGQAGQRYIAIASANMYNELIGKVENDKETVEKIKAIFAKNPKLLTEPSSGVESEASRLLLTKLAEIGDINAMDLIIQSPVNHGCIEKCIQKNPKDAVEWARKNKDKTYGETLLFELATTQLPEMAALFDDWLKDEKDGKRIWRLVTALSIQSDGKERLIALLADDRFAVKQSAANALERISPDVESLAAIKAVIVKMQYDKAPDAEIEIMQKTLKSIEGKVVGEKKGTGHE